MKLNKMREQMAQTFIDCLTEDKLPWHALWDTSAPENALTAKPYRGANSFWLSLISWSKGYSDPRWCTFKQASEKGWKVKKGEHASNVEFWSLYDKKTKKTISDREARNIVNEDPDRKDDIILMSRVYSVFNAEQIEGIPERLIVNKVDIDFVRSKRDTLLTNMGVAFQEGGAEAFYSPKKDSITMPKESLFIDTYSYMSVFLHECGHATGHESRLNRSTKNRFGSEDYAKEELRAEIASAFTAQSLNLGEPFNAPAEYMRNHKAYIQSWIEAIKDQPNELFAAIKDAEKISDYLLEKGDFLPEHSRDTVEIEENGPCTESQKPPLESIIADAALAASAQKTSSVSHSSRAYIQR